MRILWSVLLWSLVTGLAQAGPLDSKSDDKSVWSDPGWRQTVDRCTIKFDEQGLSTTTCEFEFTAQDRKGVEAISQQVFRYNSYFDELICGDLVTVKVDGRVIAVDARAIHDEAASTDETSPYFDELRKRVIAFPNVATGDKIRGRLIYRDRRARLPGEFTRVWHIRPNEPPEVMELTLDGPASRPLKIFARDVEHSEERHGERIVHRVRFNHDTPHKAGEIGGFDLAPRFEASTIADYATLAGMLNARNAPMAAPSESLKSLAANIVKDASTNAEKVERLYNWVAENIRYVGVGFEDGGLTSQPAEAVVTAGYGDCKAHVTLLKALLATQGIAANFVVVNSGSRYTLTELATSNFDHAIIYVPELDIYLDPTAAKFGFGSLPPRLGGKPVLNLDTGGLSRIPVTLPERQHYGYDVDYVIAADGTRQGRAVSSGRGSGAALWRYLAERLDDDLKRVASDLIKRTDENGTANLSVPDTYTLSDVYAAAMDFNLEKTPIGKIAPFRIAPLPDFREQLLPKDSSSVSDQPFTCGSIEYDQTVSMGLPPGLNVMEKPAPVVYSEDFHGKTPYGDANGHAEVAGDVIVDGRTVRSKAHLQIRLDAAICPASFAGEIKKAREKFDEIARSSVALASRSTPFITETNPAYNAAVQAYVRKDYSAALALFKPLAEAGHPTAQFFLGSIYESGNDVAIDRSQAARWYRLAAEQGAPMSQARLGYLYEKGLGVARDDALAAQWYERAAAGGDPSSQSNLGAMYRDGRGVARNYKEAERWFSAAAKQGSVGALTDVGFLYTLGGNGLPQDYIKAVEFFRKAAEGGDAAALYNLGWAYENGCGVSADRRQAIEWYSKAASKGNSLATKRLDRLNEEGGLWWAFRLLVGR